MSWLPDHPDLHSFPTRRSSDLASRTRIRTTCVPGRSGSDLNRKLSDLLSKRPSVGNTFVQRLPLSANDASVSRTSGSDRKSTRLNSSHLGISYAVFCLKKKKKS